MAGADKANVDDVCEVDEDQSHRSEDIQTLATEKVLQWETIDNQESKENENASSIREDNEKVGGKKANKLFSGFRESAKRMGDSIINTSKEKFGSAMHSSTVKAGKKMHQKSKKYAKKWIGSSKSKQPTQGFNSNRKLTKQGTSQFRRGPIPVENLPASEGCASRSTHGTLDSDEEDPRVCSPSSKGLLVYFRTLSKTAASDEEVDLKFVYSLLEAGADINHEDRYGQTALHAIARDWHVDVAKFVLGHGAIINKQDSFGRTPLHLAAAVDYHEMVEFLAYSGAIIDVKSNDGQTPLHFACKNSAVNSVKTLMKLEANINERDNNLRTPLFVAAESGRADAVKILLAAEAPAGVYDVNGNSAMAFMIEKMPAVAYEALAQFSVDDRALRRTYYYLNQLETDSNKKRKGQNFAKNALEMIVVYKETDLVMHPVIQKMISVKWNLFARRKSWIDLAVNLFYTLIWIVLAALIPRDANFYNPVAAKAWRIVLEAICLLLSIYFVIKEVRTFRKMRRIDLQWRDWTVRNLENELENCHPKWPDERKYIESEIIRVWNFNGTYSRNMFWSVYEWICLFSVFAVYTTQIYYWQYPTSSVAMKLYSVTLSISVMMICLRLMKICRAFAFLSAFIVLLGHVIGATVKFAFLFFEFFIPYVCIIWLIFGGEENASAIAKVSGEESAKQFRTFDEIVFITWLMTVTADIPFSEMVKHHRVLASIICGTYYALVSVVCINLYIALMSELFTRVYENAEANASLQQALLIIFIEREMGAKQSRETKRHFHTKCSPLEDIEYGRAKGGPMKRESEINLALGNINHELKAVTESLEESGDTQTEPDAAEARAMEELLKNSWHVQSNQKDLVNQMKVSYDDVLKTQEGITNSLHAMANKVLRGEKRGRPALRRSRSANNLA